jgi:hypothetical protein
MNIQQVIMSPEWATQILKDNSHNRKLRANKVAEIAHDIKAGRWMLNPQPIAISSDGWLLDGQHRLSAIIQAKQNVPLMLALNCPPDCFKTIDIGTARTNADFFQIEGIKNYTKIAPAVRYVISYQQVPDLVWNYASKPLSKTEIHELYLANKTNYDFAVDAAVRSYSRCQQVNPTVLAALIVLAPNKEKAEQYSELLGNGVGLEITSPIYQWRQILINGGLKRTNGRYNAQLEMSSYIKSYNYWRKGIELRMFKAPTALPMPPIVNF